MMRFPVTLFSFVPSRQTRDGLDLSRRFLHHPLARLDVLIVPAGGRHSPDRMRSLPNRLFE